MLKRIIGFPFVFCIIVIAGVSLIIRATWLYCKNGGEYIMYQDGEKKLIVDIYSELKKQRKEEAERKSFYNDNFIFTDPSYAKIVEELKNKQKQQD